MLELNSWFFVLLANFLILLYVLNLILFRPLLRIFEERAENTTGAIAAAKAMDEKKEQGLEEIKQGLSDASQKAREAYETLRSGGLEKQRELLSKASGEASNIAEKAREELKAEAEKARAALKADVEKFSDDIVNKLVGV
jgi:F-type H+-transporting ATPase subunit b